jgi:regulatory protein
MQKLKVTEIRVQRRRPNRRTVVLENGDVFGIAEDVLFSDPLHVGDELTPAQIEAYLQAEAQRKLREAALRLLGYRMRSKAELQRRLREKGFPTNQITDLIRELEKKGYLNDREFALAFARDKIRNRLLGPRALSAELAQHRIAPEIVQEVLAIVYDEFPIPTLLERLLDKRKVAPGTHQDAKARKRLYQFLQRKGYDRTEILSALQHRQMLNQS